MKKKQQKLEVDASTILICYEIILVATLIFTFIVIKIH